MTFTTIVDVQATANIPGTVTKGSFSWYFPASMTPTVTLGSSESLQHEAIGMRTKS